MKLKKSSGKDLESEYAWKLKPLKDKLKICQKCLKHSADQMIYTLAFELLQNPHNFINDHKDSKEHLELRKIT